MVELHPDSRTLISGGTRPLLQDWQIRFVLDDHVARFTQGPPVDHHVASQNQADTGCGPALVKRDQAQSRSVVVGAQRLAHRRLGQAITQQAAVGQA